MKKLFEFQCSHCNHYFEELTEYTKTLTCPSCGKEADKLISTPRVHLEGHSGSFPGAAMSWEKKRKQKLADEKKKANT
jgi:putative FmdB family regulatory protein